MVIGVDPSAQGRGLAAALIQPMLERADREGLSCYLETAKSYNVGYYRRLGFEVLGEYRAGDGEDSLTYWNMRRAPRKPPESA